MNYGDHVFEPDEISIKVVEALKAEMDKAYDDGLAYVASQLLQKFEEETVHFLDQITFAAHGSNYCTAPILQLMDKSRFVMRFLSIFQLDKAMAKQIAGELNRRRLENGNELHLEHAWIDAMKAALLKEASAISKLDGAQVEVFLLRSF